jgi:hypothetical protein
MNSSKIPIMVAPSPIVLPPKYITSFDYTITDFEAFTKIAFICNLFDSDNNMLDTRTIEIAGCEYFNWGYDDSYLINILSQKLGLSTFPPIKKPESDCFKIGYDTSGNIIKFKNLTVDLSGNFILPSGFTRDPDNHVIIDTVKKPVEYKYLRFDVDGNPMVFQNIGLDQNNNPILPNGYIVDNNGSVRDPNGIHIVMVIY